MGQFGFYQPSVLQVVQRIGVPFTLLVMGLIGASYAVAASPGRGPRCSSNAWHTIETANLRILSTGVPVSRETAESCERLCSALAQYWLGANAMPNWTPKCEVVLHASDEAYTQEVGAGGRDTIASSLIDRKHGRIVSRRIDVRASQSHWQTTALGHELTHVVLAERFTTRALPRWIDEGAAILADPTEKQRRHREDVRLAMGSRAEFRVLELITLADYPPAHRWGAFYGQSAVLVQYLVEQQGSESFIRFVELSLQQGYEAALQQVYHVGIAELERRWLAHVRTRPAQDVSIASRSDQRSKTPVTVQTISLHDQCAISHSAQ